MLRKLFFRGGGSGYWGVFGTSCLGILEPVLSLDLGLLGSGVGPGQSLGHWRFLHPHSGQLRMLCVHPRPQIPHLLAVSDMQSGDSGDLF